MGSLPGIPGGAALVAVALACSLSPREATAEPFQVREVAPHTIVFYRQRAATAEMEGFVIDSAALVDTLKARVLEARGLGTVANVTVGSAVGSPELTSTDSESLARGTPEPERKGSRMAHYQFTHRFSEPFTSVSATLRLASLDEPDEGALLKQLGWGIGIVILAGLYALYRMVAAEVSFAERRQNFVSAVSHELKTPLTAIRMYSEMLQEGLVDDRAKQQEYFRTITAESERLTRLINNVLALSRIEQRQRLALRSGDVRPVVREAVEVLRPHAIREGFTLELELAERLPAVLHEPDALRQVLFNLIDNALKYARDSRDRRVTVEARSHGGAVLVTVRDRGPGVSRDQLATIFAPFYRVERELTRKHPGSGIGLALVAGLVSGMGGKVEARLGSPGSDPPGLEIRVQLAIGEGLSPGR